MTYEPRGAVEQRAVQDNHLPAIPRDSSGLRCTLRYIEEAEGYLHPRTFHLHRVPVVQHARTAQCSRCVSWFALLFEVEEAHCMQWCLKQHSLSFGVVSDVLGTPVVGGHSRALQAWLACALFVLSELEKARADLKAAQQSLNDQKAMLKREQKEKDTKNRNPASKPSSSSAYGTAPPSHRSKYARRPAAPSAGESGEEEEERDRWREGKREKKKGVPGLSPAPATAGAPWEDEDAVSMVSTSSLVDVPLVCRQCRVSCLIVRSSVARTGWNCFFSRM